jgi:hypothetical protein
LSVTTDPVTSEDVTHFLVKWRGLPYEDSTWELQQDVDPEKVKLFYKYKEPPPENERQVIIGSVIKWLSPSHPVILFLSNYFFKFILVEK